MENEIEDPEAEASAADDTRAAVAPKGWEPGTTERRFVQARSTVPQSYNAEERTIEGVFATPYRVKRWFGWEELAVTDAAINLDRVTLGQVRVLDHHNAYERGAVLGVVLDARVEDGVLTHLGDRGQPALHMYDVVPSATSSGVPSSTRLSQRVPSRR
ncbi:MAG: hypothetical protein ROR55_09555 [Devosia sp.]